MLLLMFVATTVVGALIAPHPHGLQPSALGDFSVPTAQEGRAIPVIFGTVKIAGGNTVWWGDLKSKAVHNGGLLATILSFGANPISCFMYYLGCQFMLCHGPVDELVSIQADKKTVPYTPTIIQNGNGSENYIKLNVTGTNLFGGTKTPGAGGGISGTIDFYRGLPTQQPDDYLTAKQGRVALDQSGIGYEFQGVGNGIITAESGGSSALDETLTITAVGIDGNSSHSTYHKMKFSVVGSSSGTLKNSTRNAENSNDCWADAAFSCSRVNFTIETGSTQFAPGDVFTIVTEHSSVAPAYRGKCYAAFCQLYMGTSNYLKPMAFILRRCPDPLAQGAGIANIAGDANPALAIYDLLTNEEYGLGIPPATIDASSFSAAATTLATEGLGISMQFDMQGSADQLLGEILRHCDGLIYTDPASGLWTMVLARGGYDPSALPTLTVDNVIGTPDFARGSWSETTNRVAIKYVSRAGDFCDAIISAYDPANIRVTGEVRPQTVEFKGLTSESSAALVAIRVLKTFTYPLAKIKLAANRAAWKFRPGGLFRFTWVPLGVVNQVFRITRISYGELTDGKITIDAVEDIFGINSVAFVAPPTSGWVNPVGAPQANAYEQLVELPMHIAVAGNLPAGIYIMAMAARNPATAADVFEIWPDEGGGYFDSGNTAAFCPLGFLASNYPAATPAIDSTGFTLSLSSIDLVLLESCTVADLSQGKQLLMIDGEMMSWETITENADGTYTISGNMRGIMDTVPQDHLAGAKVWFFSEGVGLTRSNAYSADQTVTAKLLPTNSAGTLPLSSATPRSVATGSRWTLPYPPGNLCMNSLPYGTRHSVITGDLVLTWSSRSRDAQAGRTPLIAQDDADVGLPAAHGYQILATVTGTYGASLGTAETFTFTGDLRAAISGAGDAPVRLDVWTFHNLSPDPTLFSLQAASLSVIMTGFGLTFGEYFGGTTL